MVLLGPCLAYWMHQLGRPGKPPGGGGSWERRDQVERIATRLALLRHQERSREGVGPDLEEFVPTRALAEDPEAHPVEEDVGVLVGVREAPSLHGPRRYTGRR